MKTEKLNELLGEVIHIACAAELASDEQIKVQAIGDIYDALASVMPVDHGTKAKVEGEGEEKAVRDGADRTGFAKFLKISDNLQLFRFRGADFVKLVGRTAAHDGQPPHCYEIKVTKLERGGIAEAKMDDKFLFSVRTHLQWLTAEKLSISAMHRFEKERIARNQRKKNRHKRHQAAKREAAGREGAARTGEEA